MNSPPAPSPASRSASGDAALVVIAVVVAGAAITHLGPVLQPFLVALFLFYATRFGVKTLSGLGMRPLTAYATLLGIILHLREPRELARVARSRRAARAGIR
jgi:predicted PurR-regulated permease PerM